MASKIAALFNPWAEWIASPFTLEGSSF